MNDIGHNMYINTVGLFIFYLLYAVHKNITKFIQQNLLVSSP